MRLRRLSANNPGFKTIHFGDGLNLIVADRAETSSQGESRNGTGKTTILLLIRYLMGGNLPPRLHKEDFEGWSFQLDITLPGRDGRAEDVVVRRSVSEPQTRMSVTGWSFLEAESEVRVEEWRAAQEEALFSLRDDHPSELTSSSLWAYLARTQYSSPTRTVPTDPDWLVGTKIGYFLGLAPNVSAAPGEVARLERQRKALNQAISEGALRYLQLDEAQLRSELAGTSRERSRLAEQLRSFSVDHEYDQNQNRANALSRMIRDLNEELLGLTNRASQLDRAINDETRTAEVVASRQVGHLYNELGVILPDQVSKRFDDVVAFHKSVVRNRAQFLAAEQEDVARRINELSGTRSRLDQERARVMEILQASVAFETFVSAQSRIAELDSLIADLNRRLESAASISEMSTNINAARADAERQVRQELRDREDFLVSGPLALFRELGDEIYADRTADLLISTGKNGAVKVTPQISGDASDGIRGVETFLLDITLLVTGLSINRSPGVLLHDSHLFDAVDHRQIASCLNIGARLADEHDFQYVVTLNSDVLSSVESEGSFDSLPYRLNVGLTDEKEDGGLFGFTFD